MQVNLLFDWHKLAILSLLLMESSQDFFSKDGLRFGMDSGTAVYSNLELPVLISLLMLAICCHLFGTGRVIYIDGIPILTYLPSSRLQNVFSFRRLNICICAVKLSHQYENNIMFVCLFVCLFGFFFNLIFFFFGGVLFFFLYLYFCLGGQASCFPIIDTGFLPLIDLVGQSQCFMLVSIQGFIFGLSNLQLIYILRPML